MFIKNISLQDFRNYERLDLDVGPSVNIIYGNNAQGKTNIIESIYVACSVASHRTGKDSDMVRFGSDGYHIKLLLEDTDGYKTEISDEYIEKPRPKRILMQDGFESRRISDYIGVCNTVIFAPEDLNIVKGAPSYRRKFLNTLIMKVSPTYVNLLGNITHSMNQKNAVLKGAKFESGADVNMDLDYWDYYLADLSAELIIYRYRFTHMLSEFAMKHHSSIASSAEELKTTYTSITGAVSVLEAYLSENNIFDEFISRNVSQSDYERIKGILSTHILSKFKSAREYDIEKGVSSVGINKDDIDISLNGLSMRSFSSQGQQRTAALALKLAELEIIRSFVSTTPVLLLDDVFSELDLKRRVSLVSAMKEAQIFITCTDKSFIADELDALTEGKSARYFHVSDGNVISE
ncbi:MAG: DNA replication and repair protein RecF [Saccharofermentans sp.]|nr:DNA replication and repair protein RecF [Saccharofermentans sp.]